MKKGVNRYVDFSSFEPAEVMTRKARKLGKLPLR
jgi:sporulation protein YlmC with PRC-barrel domain